MKYDFETLVDRSQNGSATVSYTHLFDNHDHNKLEAVGIRKKNVLTNYIAIEKRLGFLRCV